MNNTQIKNSDARIFPYYKGEYMGKSEVEYGFSKYLDIADKKKNAPITGAF